MAAMLPLVPQGEWTAAGREPVFAGQGLGEPVVRRVWKVPSG
jgi:hypothetical protein